MKMQALHVDFSWCARPEKVAEPCERNGFNSVAIPSNDRRGHGQRIHDCFLCGFDRRGDERIHVRIREVGQRIGRLFGIVGNDVCRGEGENEVAAPVTSC